MPAAQRAANWTLTYILRPLGQILLFIVISALVMSFLAILAGIILQTPWHGIDLLRVRPRIDLLKQILTQLPNTLLDGITIGFVYAVIALGYTMVYGVLKFINFAHSEIFMVGAFSGYYLARLFPHQSAATGLLVLAGSMVICAALGVTIEKLAYRPLRNRSTLTVLITAIGVSLLLQNTGQLVFGPNPKSFPALFPERNFTLPGNFVVSSNPITVLGVKL